MRPSRFVVLLLGLALGACAAEPGELARRHDALGAGELSDIDELPLCSELALDGLEVEVYPLSGTDLFLVAADGEILCLDDAAGLEAAGVTEEDIAEADENPEIVPDDTGHVRIDDPKHDRADGTPLPAQIDFGDGTPLPAAQN